MSTSESDSVTQPQTANTTDVTLTFACWLHDVRRKGWLYLFHNANALNNIKLWDWGEDGGFYHWYKTQHEKWGHSLHEYPASRDHSTYYYDENTLPQHRPEEPHFTKSSYSYPLRHSRSIFTCPDCSGEGKVRCGNCRGSGKCPNCDGRGEKGSGQNKKKCFWCGGKGECSKCDGEGKVRCKRCNGEGELLNYTSKDYKWWWDKEEEPILSKVVDRFKVKGMIKSARKNKGSATVTEFSEEEVLRTSGVINDRIRELILLANKRRSEIEAKIASKSNFVVFQQNRREYIPFSYINMSAAEKYGQYFAAGIHEPCESRRPRLPLSYLKVAFWLCLLSAIGVTAFTSPGTWALVALWTFTAGLLVVNLRRVIREFIGPTIDRWLIFDDDEHGAWRFAFVLAQAISRARVARVSDPWFTALLEPPTPDSVKGRNSFMYTIHHNRPDAPRQTEVILLGTRAQHQYTQGVASAVQSATRLTWLAGGRTAEELDNAIASVLGGMTDDARSRIEVIVIRDEVAKPLTAEQLSQACQLLKPGQVRVLDIPVRQMCMESLSGNVSEAVEQGFRQLVENSGCLPASSVMDEGVEQVKTTAETL